MKLNSITVRRAISADMPQIRRIYDSAKAYMNESGNPNQWPIGYPYDDILAEDIAAGNLFVICDDGGALHGVFAMISGIDPTYLKIYGGAWLNERSYVTLHRVASDGAIGGIMKITVDFAKAAHPDCDIRIDTHKDNLPMQAALKRLGFKKCGIIYIDTGAERTAYQLKTE